MKTFLPMPSSASAKAAWAPNPSPSGLTWVMSATLLARRRASISPGGALGVIVSFAFFTDFFEQVLDLLPLLQALIEPEKQERGHLDLQALKDFFLEERQRRFQPGHAVGLLLLVSKDGKIHRGIAQVVRALDPRHRDKADPGVIDFPDQK